MTGADRGPGVRFPPPTLFVTALAFGWLLDTRVRRLAMVHGAGEAHSLEIVGWAMVALGLMLAMWGALTFLRHKTAIYPHHPASMIVQAGPYRFTRNPMYLGFTIAHVGAAFVMNGWWPLLLLPVVLGLLLRLVIRREERYLTEAFGEAYVAYQGRVRRWL